MDPNNQPTFQPMNQTAQPDPALAIARTAPTAMPTAAGGAPPITRWQVMDQIVEAAIVRGFLLGLQWGAVYGAFGGLVIGGMQGGAFTLLAIPLGLVFGLVLGVIAGIVQGVGMGLLQTLIAVTRFYPLQSWQPFRQVMGLAGVLIAAALPLAIAVLFGPLMLFSSGVAMFVLVPSLISCVCAWRTSDQVAERYAGSMGISTGRLIYHKNVDIYHPDFQRQLFDQLQRSYQWVVLLTSLGMLSRWRQQLVELMDLPTDARICDLMSGTGELWPHLLPRLGPHGHLVAFEHAPLVARQAQQRLQQQPDPRIALHERDALHTGLPDHSVSAVTCAFGAMLIDPARVNLLADEIVRILDNHGVVGLLDLSRPESALLRWLYLSYLRWIVPLASSICNGDPKLYGILARVVAQTSVTQQLEYLLTQRGFQIYRYRLSGGCATALVGMKIERLAQPISLPGQSHGSSHESRQPAPSP